jgi:hypothetical protein
VAKELNRALVGGNINILAVQNPKRGRFVSFFFGGWFTIITTFIIRKDIERYAA